jgi:hypothetical protein
LYILPYTLRWKLKVGKQIFNMYISVLFAVSSEHIHVSLGIFSISSLHISGLSAEWCIFLISQLNEQIYFSFALHIEYVDASFAYFCFVHHIVYVNNCFVAIWSMYIFPFLSLVCKLFCSPSWICIHFFLFCCHIQSFNRSTVNDISVAILLNNFEGLDNYRWMFYFKFL